MTAKRTRNTHTATPDQMQAAPVTAAAPEIVDAGETPPAEDAEDVVVDLDTLELEAPADEEVIDIIEKATRQLPVRSSSKDVVRLEPLQQYLSEIRHYDLLDRETERELAVRYVESADPEVAHQLVTANLRLVVKIALDYRRYWMNLLDLIQEGNVGLMQAVKNYDPYKNVKLSSYASFWIKAYILKFIMDNWSLVRIGSTQAQRKLFFNLRKERERLTKLGIEPDVQNLATSLSVTENDVVEMSQRLAGNELSLDMPVGMEGEDTHLDFLPDETPNVDDRMADLEIQELFSRKLREFRATLNEKDLYLFDNRLLTENPKTLQEIGNEYNVTRERIRQIESRLMKKLKQFMLVEIPELHDFDISPRAN